MTGAYAMNPDVKGKHMSLDDYNRSKYNRKVRYDQDSDEMIEKEIRLDVESINLDNSICI